MTNQFFPHTSDRGLDSILRQLPLQDLLLEHLPEQTPLYSPSPGSALNCGPSARAQPWGVNPEDGGPPSEGALEFADT